MLVCIVNRLALGRPRHEISTLRLRQRGHKLHLRLGREPQVVAREQLDEVVGEAQLALVGLILP